jgi:hypothetical protein
LGSLSLEHNIFPRVRCFTSDRLRVMISADRNFSASHSNSGDSCKVKVRYYLIYLPALASQSVYISNSIYLKKILTFFVPFFFSSGHLLVSVTIGLIPRCQTLIPHTSPGC